MDYLHEQGDITNFAFTYDILGIYFHLSQDILVGVVLNGIVDRYKVDDNNWLQIEQYAPGISGMYFTGKSFGSGLFFRADLSLAFLNISYSEDAGTWSSEEPGIGLLLGTGWSFDLGGTRLLLNVYYARRGYTSVSFSSATRSTGLNAISLSVGGLF